MVELRDCNYGNTWEFKWIESTIKMREMCNGLINTTFPTSQVAVKVQQ